MGVRLRREVGVGELAGRDAGDDAGAGVGAGPEVDNRVADDATRATSRTPVASIARTIMYGSGRPAATSSAHTTASIVLVLPAPTVQPRPFRSGSAMSREKPVVRATLTPEARSAAIASGTPTMGDGGTRALARALP